jgi:2-desacetyl-2-hydroxyethyl bacteriochlorophyllide A dehydrogenase
MVILGIERAGAFAPYVTVPVDRVFRLPAGLDDLTGALAETLAVEVHLFRNLSAPLLRTVVVLGAGAQGLLAVRLARLAGAAQVIVSDVMPHRLELAQQMGATTIIHANHEDVPARVMALSENWGAELVVDTAGVPITRQQGLASLAPGGTLSLIGLGKGETTLDFVPVVGKELSIRGSYCYSDDDFYRSMELLASGQVRVSDMIQVAPLREGVTYFDRLTRQPDGLTKVLLKAE